MDGIKRINEMAIGLKDYVLLETIKYLTSRTDMNEKFLNPEKNIKDMESYIRGEILNDFCKNMNVKNPSSLAKEVKYKGGTTKCLAVGMSKEKVYELAINYFEKSNEELGIKNEDKKNKNDKKEIIEVKNDDEFGSIFSFIEENNANKEKESNKIEQISFFTAA